jgi:hypothetical protein
LVGSTVSLSGDLWNQDREVLTQESVAPDEPKVHLVRLLVYLMICWDQDRQVLAAKSSAPDELTHRRMKRQMNCVSQVQWSSAVEDKG